MRRQFWLFILGGLLAAAPSSARSQGNTAKSDMTKYSVVEKPTRAMVADKTRGTITADLAKTVRIEKPAKTVLAGNTTGVSSSGNEFVNPKVQSGNVRWHSSFAAACEAAKKSGKPVLLFQMMGKLDDQFC
jgi:hypothetical protein